MKQILSIILIGLTLPALAGDSEEKLRKQLDGISKQIKALHATHKELSKKRSAVMKKLHAIHIEAKAKQAAEFKKRIEAKRKERGSKNPSAEIARKKAEWAKRIAAKKKAEAAKKKPVRPSKRDSKKPSAKPLKRTPKKPTAKPSSDITKKASASRAQFLKRFDANRDGKVTKDKAKAVLTAEAKKRERDRKKK